MPLTWPAIQRAVSPCVTAGVRRIGRVYDERCQLPKVPGTPDYRGAVVNRRLTAPERADGALCRLGASLPPGHSAYLRAACCSFLRGKLLTGSPLARTGGDGRDGKGGRKRKGRKGTEETSQRGASHKYLLSAVSDGCEEMRPARMKGPRPSQFAPFPRLSLALSLVFSPLRAPQSLPGDFFVSTSKLRCFCEPRRYMTGCD